MIAKQRWDTRYLTTLASPLGGLVRSDCGASVASACIYDLDVETIDTLLVTGADNDFEALCDARLVVWLKDTQRCVRRIESICIGAFLLAEAGLLDGGQAVTHWRWCDRLRQRVPGVWVMPDQICVRYGNVWTSVGVTAGIDMALAMTEEDVGKATTLDVARTLVVFMRRPGGQSQFSVSMFAQYADTDGRFYGLHEWIMSDLSRKLDIEVLANKSGMEVRTFARLYKQHTGDTPVNMVRKMRIEFARHLLEDTDPKVSSVVQKSGFIDVENMRRVFVKDLGVAPTNYRDLFGSARR